eukprot:COSAG01_NODE_1388_length_10504_cov_15.302835_2_plen_122_part_00
MHGDPIGYYTSRPKLKGYIRSRENLLRHGELLTTAASLSGGGGARAAALGSLTKLRRAVGVCQVGRLPVSCVSCVSCRLHTHTRACVRACVVWHVRATVFCPRALVWVRVEIMGSIIIRTA